MAKKQKQPEVKKEVWDSFGGLLAVFLDLSAEYNRHARRENPIRNSVLKNHLIIEHFLEKVLIDLVPNYEDVRDKLPFNLKVKLLPKEKKMYSPLIPKLIIFNRIRNTFIHNLEATISEKDLLSLKIPFEIGDSSNNNVQLNPQIKILEDFTLICACTFMFYSKEMNEKYSNFIKYAPKFEEFLAKFNFEGWLEPGLYDNQNEDV